MTASLPAMPLADMERLAVAIAKSRLFGITTPEQALSLMAISQAEGMHPALAARDYHVIQGRPTLKADAMLARFQFAGGKVEWHDYTDAKVSATFSHPQGGTVTVDWDLARAKRAGVGSGDNWRKYPRNMLRARVASEGIRAVYPGVLVGIYTPEEARDFSPPRPSRAPAAEVDATDAEWTQVKTTDAEWTELNEGTPYAEPEEARGVAEPSHDGAMASEVESLMLRGRQAAQLGSNALKAFWLAVPPARKSELKHFLDFELKPAADAVDAEALP